MATANAGRIACSTQSRPRNAGYVIRCMPMSHRTKNRGRSERLKINQTQMTSTRMAKLMRKEISGVMDLPAQKARRTTQILSEEKRKGLTRGKACFMGHLRLIAAQGVSWHFQLLHRAPPSRK